MHTIQAKLKVAKVDLLHGDWGCYIRNGEKIALGDDEGDDEDFMDLFSS